LHCCRCIACIVLSGEVSVPIIEQYPVYYFKLELRAGYVF
jgi:hypothetical protein